MREMARHRLSIGIRWRIIGMKKGGMSCKAIGRQLGYHKSVITRLVQKHAQTSNVKDHARSGRSRITSNHEDRALLQLDRRFPFASTPKLRNFWNTNR